MRSEQGKAVGLRALEELGHRLANKRQALLPALVTPVDDAVLVDAPQTFHALVDEAGVDFLLVVAQSR